VHEVLVQEIACKRSSSSNAATGGEGQQGKKRKMAAVGPKMAAGEEDGVQKEVGEEQDHILESYFGSRALRRLVLASCETGAGSEGAKAFVSLMWNKGLQGKCSSWAGTHADKVLAALVHCGVAEVVAAAAEELGPLVGGDAQAWSDKINRINQPQQQKVKKDKSAGKQAGRAGGLSGQEVQMKKKKLR
jgi:pumilio family protein 6